MWEKWQKTEGNDINKKSEKEESQAVDWGGEKSRSHKLPFGSLQSPTFWGSFSTTAELGPRHALTKPLRT